MFVPPINLGQFQPSPATIAEWVYQIWQYLQENPIATQEQIQEFIRTFITTSPTVQEMIGEGVDNYLIDNPPAAPVQSVQGKTGDVQLAYNDIVTSSNAVPVYKSASTPSTSTLTGQYNLGYRLFVNTTTQEIYTISPAGALSLVGKGIFDGTTIDLNTAQGDTTIAEAIAENADDISTLNGILNNLIHNETVSMSITTAADEVSSIVGNLPTVSGYRPAFVRSYTISGSLSSFILIYALRVNDNNTLQLYVKNLNTTTAANATATVIVSYLKSEVF